MVFTTYRTDGNITWDVVEEVLLKVKLMTHHLSSRQTNDDGAKEFFSSYKDVISLCPAGMIDHLRLYLDDELCGRLSHFEILLEVALSHKGDEGVFVEGLEISGFRGMHPKADYYNENEDYVADFTSSNQRAPEKKGYLDRTFKAIKYRKSVVFLPTRQAIGRMRTFMQWLVEKTVGPEMETAKRLAFMTEEAREDVKELYEDIMRISLEASKQQCEPPDSKVKVDSERLFKISRSNGLHTMKMFCEDFNSSPEFIGLQKYLKSDVPLKARKSYRYKPCNQEKIEASRGLCPMSRFMLFLRDNEDEIPNTWCKYYDGMPLENYPDFRKKRKQVNYLVGAGEPQAVLRKVSHRVYDIVFNLDTLLVDKHMSDALQRHDFDWEEFEQRRDIKEAQQEPSLSSRNFSPLQAYTEAFEQVEKDMEEVPGDIPFIFHKLTENSTEMTLSRKVRDWNKGFIDLMSPVFKTKTARGMAHEYEIAKSVSQSFCCRPEYDRYFLSSNGNLNSISLIQRNCTNDSMTNLWVVTAYVPPSEENWVMHKSVSFNTNTLHWALKKPFVSFVMVRYLLETRMSEIGPKDHILFDSNFMLQLVTVNRNIFAQAADQMRYLFTASLCYGTTSAGIFKKLSTLQPVCPAEVVYVCNLVKVCAALNKLKEAGFTKFTNKGSGVNFAMPHDRGCSTSMQYFVSSMYMSRLFNKNRAFSEPSCAFSAQGVLDEIDIMNEMTWRAPEINSSKDEILEGLIETTKRTGNRYVGNPLAAACLTMKYRPSSTSKAELFKSTMNAAMNNHAAMSGRDVCGDRQVSKSFLVAHEAINHLTGTYPGYPNTMNLYYLQAISMIMKAFDSDAFHYCAYLTHKDQVGEREIYVMNGYMRIGTFFCEELARAYSRNDSVNLQNTDMKEYFMEEAMKEAHHASLDEEGRTWELYDNADSKRWGPNMMMSVLAAHFVCLNPPEDYDISALGLFTFSNMSKKRIKMPESLISFAKNHPRSSHRGVVGKFMTKHRHLLVSSSPYVVEKEGMGQGLFQELSSELHAVRLEFLADLNKTFFGGDLLYVRYFATSDDSQGTLVLKVGDNEIPRTSPVVKQLLSMAKVSGCWFSILRNLEKSGWSSIYAEFNSRFYYKRSPAMATAKYLAAKVDCGVGSDIFSDLCTALESSGDYAAFGGSYLGSHSLLVANYTMTLEQWGLTRKGLSETEGVTSHIGFLKFIDPVICQTHGPVANIVLSDIYQMGPNSIKNLKNSELKEICKSLTQEMAEVYTKLESPLVRGDDDDTDFWESESSGFYSGFVGLSRTPKFLSSVGASKFKDLTPFVRTFPIFSNVSRNLSESRASICYRASKSQVTSDDTELHKRFSDPWVSKDRECFRRAKGSSAAAKFIPDEKVSFNMVKSAICKEGFAKEFFEELKASKPELEDNLQPFADVWEEKIRGGIAVIESMSNFDNTIQLLVKRDVPDLCSKVFEVPTVSQTDKDKFLFLSFADKCGSESLPNILELSSDISEVFEKITSDPKIYPEEYRDKHMRFESCISKFMPKRRKVMIPVKDSVAVPYTYFSHMMKDKFFEGAGYENSTEELRGVEEVFMTEVHLIKEEATAFKGLAEMVSEHLNIIADGGDSNLLKITRDSGLLAKNKIETYLGRVTKSKIPIKRITSKILAAAFSDDPIHFTEDESKLVLAGKLSVASKMPLNSNSYTQFHPSTKFYGDSNTPGMHFVVKALNEYMHYFCFTKPKLHNLVSYVTLASCNSSFGFKKEEVVYDGKRSDTGNFIRFLYPENLTTTTLVSSPTSTCLCLKIGSCKLPLFPLSPDIKSLNCMKIQNSDFRLGLDAACKMLSEEADNPLDPNPRKLPKVEDTLVELKFRETMTTPVFGAVCAKLLLRKNKIETNTGTLHNMVTNPFRPMFVKESLFTSRTLVNDSENDNLNEDTGGQMDYDEEQILDIFDDEFESDEPDHDDTIFDMEVKTCLGALVELDPGGRKPADNFQSTSLLRTSSAKNFLLTMRKAYLEALSTSRPTVKSVSSFREAYGEVAAMAYLAGMCSRKGSLDLDRMGYLTLLLSLRF